MKLGTHHTSETRKKISNVVSKAMKKPEVFAKMSAKRKGNKNCVGRKISNITRMKISIANKGKLAKEKNPAWRGGISKINKTERNLIMGTLEYRLWRESVFERDNYTCIWCGIRSGKGEKVILHADHIKPYSLYPELRFAIDNGRTLCIECHKKTDSWGNKIKRYYDKK